MSALPQAEAFGEAAPELSALVHDSIRALGLSEGFSCLGAKAALNRGTYRFGMYQELGSADSARRLAEDLTRFEDLSAVWDGPWVSYIASFVEPGGLGEKAFEARLWRHLELLHDADREVWDPAVSSDPADPRFSFSFGGSAYFVVGLHGGASRWTRRFGWPTLVFNPHRQFDQLRADGRLPRLQERIRARERELQGEVNPVLGEYGSTPEARQYSGRLVEPGWRCPFHDPEAP